MTFTMFNNNMFKIYDREVGRWVYFAIKFLQVTRIIKEIYNLQLKLKALKVREQ